MEGCLARRLSRGRVAAESGRRQGRRERLAGPRDLPLMPALGTAVRQRRRARRRAVHEGIAAGRLAPGALRLPALVALGAGQRDERPVIADAQAAAIPRFAHGSLVSCLGLASDAPPLDSDRRIHSELRVAGVARAHDQVGLFDDDAYPRRMTQRTRGNNNHAQRVRKASKPLQAEPFGTAHALPIGHGVSGERFRHRVACRGEVRTLRRASQWKRSPPDQPMPGLDEHLPAQTRAIVCVCPCP